MHPAMKGLAFFRIVLGTFAWLAPSTMNRVFGVRAVSLGLGYLASSGEARELWHQLWLLCDSADTAMGAAMAARGRLPVLTAVQALAITGGATAIDLAAMGQAPVDRRDAQE